MLYGAEVTGAHPSIVWQLRAWVASVWGHPYASKVCLFACYPKLDPAPRMASAPLVRYAEELWRAASKFWRNGR
eukprot:12905294-Prorocentrum_lima.AAC.1